MEIMSVKKALDILSLLQREGELGVTEIGKKLEINKSTVYRLLYTLKQQGFVRQNSSNEKYWLGMKLYSLGDTIGNSLTLKSFVRPVLQKLSEELGEYIHLAILATNEEKDFEYTEAPKLVVIERFDAPHQLSLMPVLHTESPCHCSAMGKCLLAFSSKTYLDQFQHSELPALTKNTITDWSKLATVLEAVRERGYAEESNEIEIGLSCIAFPIFSKQGKILAAFSVSGSDARISLKKEQIIANMEATSKELSYIYSGE